MKFLDVYGFSCEDIRKHAKAVTKGHLEIMPCSNYLKAEKKSKIFLQFFHKGKLIQKVEFGLFEDKYEGFYKAHIQANKILQNDLTSFIRVTSTKGESVCHIKPEFYGIEGDLQKEYDHLKEPIDNWIINRITCKCGKRVFRMYSPLQDTYFVGCADYDKGENHPTRKYSPIDEVLFELGLLEDLYGFTDLMFTLEEKRDYLRRHPIK